MIVYLVKKKNDEISAIVFICQYYYKEKMKNRENGQLINSYIKSDLPNSVCTFRYKSNKTKHSLLIISIIWK